MFFLNGIERIVANWIYPAYCLRNLLFHRYDLVKIKKIKPWDWCDKSEALLWVNMQLIVDFVEKDGLEEAECWYVRKGYGDNLKDRIYLPEEKGKYILDMIKEIYHWWKEKYPELCNDSYYITSYWVENISGETIIEEGNVLSNDNSACPKTFEELQKKEGIKWEILYKYLTKEELLNETIVLNKCQEIDKRIFEETQKYLHMCVEVRPYLLAE